MQVMGGGDISFSYFKVDLSDQMSMMIAVLYGGVYVKNSKFNGCVPISQIGDYTDTLVGIAVINDGATICNVGDSPTYINKGKSIYDFLDNIESIGGFNFDVPSMKLKLKSLEITEEEFYNFN